MNIVEKYNQTIELIEEMAEREEHSAKEIGEAAAVKNGLQLRDMSTVFMYLQDTTLHAYIMMRKLTAAYRFLINNKDISQAVAIAGYSDQPSFSKAFKRQFGMTPKEVFITKDRSKITKPITWEELSGNTASLIFNHEESDQVIEQTIFGVSEHSFEKVSSALELEAFYGFTRMFSTYAYELSEKTGHTLEECFAYVDSLREYGGDYTEAEEYDQTPEEALRKTGDDEINQQVFFARGISVSIIDELRYWYGASLEELMKCDMEMLNMFPGFDQDMEMSFSYYIRAYERFAEYADIGLYPEIFYDYISKLMIDTPIEVALAEALVDVDFEEWLRDGCPGDDFDMEREKQELETYRSAEGLMAEKDGVYDYSEDTYDPYDESHYDPDNPEYDDDYDSRETDW